MHRWPRAGPDLHRCAALACAIPSPVCLQTKLNSLPCLEVSPLCTSAAPLAQQAHACLPPPSLAPLSPPQLPGLPSAPLPQFLILHSSGPGLSDDLDAYEAAKDLVASNFRIPHFWPCPGAELPEELSGLAIFDG